MQITSFKSVEQICGHTILGHWEYDLVIIRQEHGKANLTSLIERKSRYIVLAKNDNRRATAQISRFHRNTSDIFRAKGVHK